MTTSYYTFEMVALPSFNIVLYFFLSSKSPTMESMQKTKTSAVLPGTLNTKRNKEKRRADTGNVLSSTTSTSKAEAAKGDNNEDLETRIEETKDQGIMSKCLFYISRNIFIFNSSVRKIIRHIQFTN